MTSDRSEFVVVGGGIVGLATARQLLRENPGSSLELFEKEDDVARHQTGHNSGVVHAGLYYAPGSAKSTLCRRGVGLLKEFCEEHDIDYRVSGKMVIARNGEERVRLRALEQRATDAGVPGLEFLGPAGIAEREPAFIGVEALLSSTTAVVDYIAVSHALAQDITSLGGSVHLNAEVQGITENLSDVVVRTSSGTVRAKKVVNCAGLQADHVASFAKGPKDPKILPFRGEYLRIAEGRDHLVRGLVYPVPDPRYPFLGVHFTRRISGMVDVGPNAILALAREGYRWRDVRGADLVEMARWPGTWRMAGAHWRTGIYEALGSASRRIVLQRARTYLPALELDDLLAAPAGVRAQAVSREGRLLDDFAWDRSDRVLSIRNAPSPAATASLAIAEKITELLGTPA
jgi:(S)-2-hydroxyglutarate dehydrogenase